MDGTRAGTGEGRAVRAGSRLTSVQRRASRLSPLIIGLLLAQLVVPGWAVEPEEPFCEHGLIRIIRPQPVDEFDHWVPEENPEQGFLSSTAVRCEAEVAEGVDPATVRWRIKPQGAKTEEETVTGAGRVFTFTPNVPASRRRSERLAFEIVAEVRDPVTGAVARDTVTICQDEIDEIRQEYVDFPRRSLERVPREAFVDRESYEQEWASPLPWEAMNKTRSRRGEPYSYILIDPAVVEGMRRWRELLGGRELVITSGYRNPYKQAITSTRRGGREAAPAGLHQYGKAVDVRANVTKDFRDWVTVAWAAVDAGADYVETIPEGSWHHVHADWRRGGQGPADTVKLRITGRVTDADGAPIQGATIVGVSDAVGKFAGMPAWQSPDADGRFELRTVWHPGKKYQVRVQAGKHRQVLAFTLPKEAELLVERELNVVVPLPKPAPGAAAPAESSASNSKGLKKQVRLP